MGIQPSAKEIQHARQQTASSVPSAMGKALTGEPWEIVVVGNGPEACSASPVVPTRTLTELTACLQLQMSTKLSIFVQFLFHSSKEGHFHCHAGDGLQRARGLELGAHSTALQHCMSWEDWG